jgi:DNA-directed RNA polymerase subunit RPC12/RpoP
VKAEAMSELKFACPVCGQHITADSSTSGGQLECPTCFQKIVVPQAPASADTKFILSAAQVGKPRPASIAAPSEILSPAPARTSVLVIAALLLLLCAAGAALFVFRGKIVNSIRPHLRPTAKLPANIAWSLDLKNTTFPETNAQGRIHGSLFVSERASLEGGRLSLRQGKTWPPDLGITLQLPTQPGEDLAGKTVEVAPDQPPPVPYLTVRWKDDHQQPAKQDVKRGYALKLAFGQPAKGRLPGKIYLCLPDEARSVVAGTFNAEVRKPKPSPPKAPQTKG